jgi:hypothetical protein
VQRQSILKELKWRQNKRHSWGSKQARIWAVYCCGSHRISAHSSRCQLLPLKVTLPLPTVTLDKFRHSFRQVLPRWEGRNTVTWAMCRGCDAVPFGTVWVGRRQLS